MRSPGSRVISWERSATSRANGKSRSSLVSSCTSSPLSQVRTRRRGGVDGCRVDHARADRRVAVAALGAQVGALVRLAQVVEAEVVGRRDAGDVAPGVLEGDAPGGLPMMSAISPSNPRSSAPAGRSTVPPVRERGRRLQEVRRLRRASGRAGRPGRVVDVHGDDLAGLALREAARSSKLMDVLVYRYPKSYTIMLDHGSPATAQYSERLGSADPADEAVGECLGSPASSVTSAPTSTKAAPAAR